MKRLKFKIGDIVKDKRSELRCLVIGASPQGYDLLAVWPSGDRYVQWQVGFDGRGDHINVVPCPDWDAEGITRLQTQGDKE